MSPKLNTPQIKTLTSLAFDAGKLALKHQGNISELNIQKKNDGSELSNADIATNQLISQALQSQFANIPIVSEEGNEVRNLDIIRSHSTFFIVDPIDGTSSFIQGSPEYTINICLIENGVPEIGIINIPRSSATYYCDYQSSHKITHDPSNPPQTQSTIQTSWPHNNHLILLHSPRSSEMRKISRTIKELGMAIADNQAVSSSIKLCRIAEGTANIYIRESKLKKWDIAAGEAIIRRAGGSVITKDFQPINYTSHTTDCPPFFCLGCKSQTFLRHINPPSCAT